MTAAGDVPAAARMTAAEPEVGGGEDAKYRPCPEHTVASWYCGCWKAAAR